MNCLMGEFAHIGRKHQDKHPAQTLQSILYWHYNMLVASEQTAFRCTANAVEQVR